MNKGLIGTGGLATAFVILIGINVLSTAFLGGRRIDLTEGRVFTLSQGSVNIVRSLDEPIKLRFYYSAKLASNIPELSSHAQLVRELLVEYEKAARGMVKLEIIDPEPFTEAEERAVASGITPIPRGNGENIYLGIEGVNSTDQQGAIPLLSPSRAAFLEYDISQLIFNLSNPKMRKIAVISPLPLGGTRFDPMNPVFLPPDQEKRPWIIMDAARQIFEVSYIDPPLDSIPADTDAIFLVHPAGLNARDRYYVDQYILGGGKALILVDPHADVQEVPAGENPMQAMTAPKGSNLEPLFKAWGIKVDEMFVVGDRSLAQDVALDQTGKDIAAYVLLPALTRSNFNTEDPITSSLELLKFFVPGAIQTLPDAKATVTPLISTTKDSMLIDVEKARFFPDPKELIAKFNADEKQYVLAARISGQVPSAYGEAPPAGVTNPNHLAASKGPINVIVVADADFIADRFWAERYGAGGRSFVNYTSNNGHFVLNALEQLSGSSDLISVRNRGRYFRPFTVVKAIEEQAKKDYYAKEQDLQAALREVERKINELIRADASGNRVLTLSKEQQEEIEKFRKQQAETTRQLRDVQRSLRTDVEALGRKLKFLNIGLIPILVSLFAVTLGIVKVQRRKRR